MSKEITVFLSGFILILVPFLGVPPAWQQYLIVGIGALLVIVGYVQRRSIYLRRLERGNGERGNDTFVETTERLFE